MFVTGRRKKELDAAVAEVGRGTRRIQSDIGNLANIDRLFAVVEPSTFCSPMPGGGEFAAIGEITEQHYDRTFGINVKGTLFTKQSPPASPGWQLDHPHRLHFRIDRHTGVQRLQRQQGRHTGLCAQLAPGPGPSEGTRERAYAGRNLLDGTGSRHRKMPAIK